MPTFLHERDEIRAELRQNVAGTVRLIPKVGGANVVLSPTTAAYTIHDPSGAEIASGTANATAVGSPTEYHYVDVPVSAISTLDENYQVRATWTAFGESATRYSVREFDIVLYPYGELVSVNDLREMRPDVVDVLDRVGILLGYSAGDTAVLAAASVYAVAGRRELDALVRAACAEVASSSETSAPGVVQYARPSLVLNRESLVIVERHLALRELFAALAIDPEEGTDEDSARYRYHRAAAGSAWRAVGPLRFHQESSLDGGSAAEKVIGRVFLTRRVQAP